MRKATFLLATVLVVLLVAGAGSVFAGDDGQWMIRGRLIYVSPDASADGELGAMKADVDDDFTAEVDFTCFFTDHWAIEGLVATTSHSIEITEGGDTGSLGSASLLLPTVLLQYHFVPDGKFQPYVGAGVNYTICYDQTGMLDWDDFDDLDNSFGLALQVGADIQLANGMYFNMDLKYITIDTDVVYEGDKLGALDIDPWVFGVGFGWRF